MTPPRSVLAAINRGLLAREFSARELVERSLRRIKASDSLNAVVLVAEDAALHDADLLDRAIGRGEPLRALSGAPTLVKDVEDVEGQPTRQGSILLQDISPATRDGAIPGLLRQAGAIIVGRTNTPEFAMEAWTANRLFGITHNPWRHGWSPGGSSGGSAAALAAGLAAISTASDGGGSTRTPAALCGLIGLKPTTGLLPHGPVELPVELSGQAPMASTTEDLRRLLEVECRTVPGDPSSHGRPSPPRDDWPRRILAIDRLVGREPIGPAVAVKFREALERMSSSLHLPVEYLDPGSVFDGDVHETWATMYAPEQTVRFGRDWLRDSPKDLERGTLAWLGLGLSVSFEAYLAARQMRFAHVLRLDELLGDDTVLATPTLTIEGYPADGRLPGATEPDLPTDLFNTAPLNLTGHPALTVPAGLNELGLPFGLQLIGPRLGDVWLLDMASRWERAEPWPMTAPGYEPIVEIQLD